MRSGLRFWNIKGECFRKVYFTVRSREFELGGDFLGKRGEVREGM